MEILYFLFYLALFLVLKKWFPNFLYLCAGVFSVLCLGRIPGTSIGDDGDREQNRKRDEENDYFYYNYCDDPNAEEPGF